MTTCHNTNQPNGDNSKTNHNKGNNKANQHQQIATINKKQIQRDQQVLEISCVCFLESSYLL